MIRWTLFTTIVLFLSCDGLERDDDDDDDGESGEWNACEMLAQEVCNICDVSDAVEDTMCACLEDGEVDNASRYFADKDAAEQWCYRLKQELETANNTDESSKQCLKDLDYIREYGDDACVDLGYDNGENAGGGNDTGWGHGDADAD